MSQGIFTLILVSILLAQCCLARPTEKDRIFSDELQESIKSAAISYASKEIGRIGNLFLEKGSELVKKTLADETVTKVSTALMRQYTEDLHDLVKKVDSIKGNSAKQNTPEYFGILEAFGNSIDKIIFPKRNETSAEQEVLELAVRKYGIYELKQDVTQQFKQLLVRFESVTDKYLAGLSEQEKLEKADLLKLYENYKKENNIKRKAMMFLKLLEEHSLK